MCKAEKVEKRALEAYPVLMCYNDFQMVEEDINKPLRKIYEEGYYQAEKDLELTLEDVKQICDIAFEEACRLQRNMKSSHIYKEQHYQEVLKRFNEERKKE